MGYFLSRKFLNYRDVYGIGDVGYFLFRLLGRWFLYRWDGFVFFFMGFGVSIRISVLFLRRVCVSVVVCFFRF